MYKDKDKQREANRKAQAKFKAKGITQAVLKGITEGAKLQKKMGITEGISERVLSDAELKAHCVKVIPKRGKDIQCFEDLPLDVQQAINKEEPDQRARRTAAAIKYQHLFPDRYAPSYDQEFTRRIAKA